MEYYCDLQLSKNCLNCDKLINKLRTDCKKNWENKKFCSIDCKTQHSRSNPTGFENTTLSKECKCCGKEFFKGKEAKSRWDIKKYCSPECRKKSMIGINTNKTHCRFGHHLWIPENISEWVDKKGNIRRVCKLCKRDNFINRDGIKETVKTYNRRFALKNTYGLSIDEYNGMIKNQDGKCKICGVRAEDVSRGLSVDHCHETGKIRGILCHKCNSGLGFFNDDEELVERGLNYLKENK